MFYCHWLCTWKFWIVMLCHVMLKDFFVLFVREKTPFASSIRIFEPWRYQRWPDQGRRQWWGGRNDVILGQKVPCKAYEPDENFCRCWSLASGNHDENESITGGRCAIRFVHATMKGMNVLVDLLRFLFWRKEQLLLVYFCTALVGASLWPVVPKSHSAAVVAEF